MKKYLSVREYAIEYGISPATVYAMCARKKLAHVRLGVGRGTIRIPLTEADDRTGEPGRSDQPTPPKAKRVKLQHLRMPT
jgi:hypothetical protein